MHTLLNADDGSNYNQAESISLLDISDEIAEELTEQQIIDKVKFQYSTGWCNCLHDCCGHWKSEVCAVAVDMIARRAVIYTYHSQNV